jgi:hypothetical protein
MVTYSYIANSPLIDHIVFQQSGMERMRTTPTYDKLNRLVSIVSTANTASTPVFGDTYEYNVCGKGRTSMTGAMDVLIDGIGGAGQAAWLWRA